MQTGRPKRLKLEDRIALARRYHAGETAKVLSEAFGVSRRHVTRLAKEERGEGQEVRDPSMAVSFRTAQSELALFDIEWRDRGFATRSQALQAMVRARCGLLDLVRDDVRAFSEALQRAQDVSDGARILAKAVQRGKLTLASGDRDVLSELLVLAQDTHRELAMLKAAVHGRRGKGWRSADHASETCNAEAPGDRSDPEPPRPSRPLGNLETRMTIASAELEDRRPQDV